MTDLRVGGLNSWATDTGEGVSEGGGEESSGGYLSVQRLALGGQKGRSGGHSRGGEGTGKLRSGR